MYQNSTYESNPISHISCCHNANPLFLSRGSENLFEGRCFKRLIIQVTISHTPSVHLCLEACVISCWSGQIQQLIPVLSLTILSPLPYPALWRKEEKKRREWKGKEKRSTPASSKIREISFGAILEVAMVMDNSDHQGAEVTGAAESIELQSYGHTGAERAPEGLPIWENDWLVQPTLHAPAKPFWWTVQPFHIQMEHYLALLTAQHSLGLWWSLFHHALMGPPKNNLKLWTIASEASEFS